MIPVKLSFQGLYSYKEKLEIDFETLVSSKLFGIFGAVGSGKSSILEAIVFVLFDRSDRLNKSGDNRYYNMLNLQSDELLIDFSFKAGKGNNDLYRFNFSAKRKQRDFEKVEVKNRSFYHWKNDDWLPIENIQDASEILGMTYENFRQTVIVPQGKFREFIDQKTADRTKMLKELFQLERFDLFSRTNILLGRTKTDIEVAEAKIGEQGEISEGDVNTISEQIKHTKTELEKEQVLLDQLRKEEAVLDKLKKLFEDIHQLEEERQLLLDDQDMFLQKEKQLAIYEKALTFFDEKLKILDHTLDDIKKKQTHIQELRDQLATTETACNTANENYEQAQRDFQNKGDIEQKAKDLNNIIKIKEANETVLEISSKIELVRNSLATIEERKRSSLEALQNHEGSIEKLEKKLEDHLILTQLQQWNLKNNELAEELSKQQKEKEVVLSKEKELRNKQVELIKTHQDLEPFVDYRSFLKDADDFETKKIKTIEALEIDIREWKVKQEMANYSENLKEGEPCPLCGSKHHPSPAEIETVDEQIAASERALELQKDDIRIFRALKDNIRELESEIVTQRKYLEQCEGNIATLKVKEDKHRGEFVWETWRDKDLAQIEILLQESTAEKKTLQELKEKVAELRKVLDNIETELNGQNEKLNITEKESARKEGEIEQLKGAIQILDVEKFQKYPIEQLQTNLQKGEKQLSEINAKYEHTGSEKRQLEQELNTIKGQLKSEEKNLEQTVIKAQKLDEQIKNLVIEKGFKEIDEIRNILQTSLNIEEERKALSHYQQRLQTVTAQLELLKKEASDHSYGEENHIKLKDEIERLVLLTKELGNKLAGLKHEKGDLEKRLVKIRDFKAELDKLTIRKHDLSELSHLFRGSGFVNYVSSIYLNNLCRIANERFFKLTNNNLSLELNENNEFIVRDYLNNGKTRLLKTLSGGQTFQAALCLALALAENIKSLNQADQSFFFLDEGFGALDKNALRVVFETLKSLQKENRIVGIISHVEELQQEIDIYLKIENDKERGSLISYSWN
ncbi:SMC family ATPase [Fulvivirgaceae bacterium BMA10]|uniref:SMC family ATPase n=1 Tax=Splendidivirga corallicola TaxID=3051826 RepID=A0ABT8KRW9_9BACT|nr:SMC family ATPase [Fulvivirgaceae bacterium BMA10]